jgi:hypothetical protein
MAPPVRCDRLWPGPLRTTAAHGTRTPHGTRSLGKQTHAGSARRDA